MRSLGGTALVVVAGVIAGSMLMLAAPGTLSAPATTSTVTEEVLGKVATPPTTASAHVTGSLPEEVLLVWTSGGLPDAFADQVRSLVDVTAVTSVRSDLVHLTESNGPAGELIDRVGDGYLIPIEVMAFEPATYPAFLPDMDADVFARLGADEAVLGATSAELRRIGPGATLLLEDGSVLTVADVVDDVLIGGAEAAIRLETAARLGVSVERYLLIRHSGERPVLERTVADLLPDGTSVRIRGPGETPALRHGDAVLPQVSIKEVFGEFAYRPGPGTSFEIDPNWVEANVVSADVPILGTVTCHRSLIPPLSAAMTELAQGNLAFLVDPEQYRGCFNPRFIAPGKGISRHSWGAAVDINMGSNREGLESSQDPRLVEVMERWGFTSGHDWLVPDPGHFEYVRPAG